MTLNQLIEWATNKTRFTKVEDYAIFCEEYLAFVYDGLQAVIVSQNENQYRFFQYKEDGNYNVSRPINSNLMISAEDFLESKNNFQYAIRHIREMVNATEMRNNLNRFVYTCQQAIGAALDALPAGGVTPLLLRCGAKIQEQFI